MSLMNNKNFWDAHDNLIRYNQFYATSNPMRIFWGLEILEKAKKDSKLSEYFMHLNMYEFIWFEFIINFFSKFIYNYSRENYAYCNEYLKHIYDTSYRPFLIQFNNRRGNLYAASLCHILLDKYAKTHPEFEKVSIAELDKIVDSSIDFINYLDLLIYPSVKFKTVFRNNIEKLEVQDEFNLLSVTLGQKYYNRLKEKLHDFD